MIVSRRVTHASPYRGMALRSMETINYSGKLLAIHKFADTILSEFDPELLEFKDFSAYQEESIKKGTGYSVHPAQYREASVGNGLGTSTTVLWRQSIRTELTAHA